MSCIIVFLCDVSRGNPTARCRPFTPHHKALVRPRQRSALFTLRLTFVVPVSWLAPCSHFSVACRALKDLLQRALLLAAASPLPQKNLDRGASSPKVLAPETRSRVSLARLRRWRNPFLRRMADSYIASSFDNRPVYAHSRGSTCSLLWCSCAEEKAQPDLRLGH